MDTITLSKIGDFKVIPVAQLHPSHSNPRKRFSEDWINELADSIKDVGIMQPIVVRPHPQVEGEYQIVSGECRYRAALKAELAIAPTMVRHLTDAQMLKLQIIENLKRRDIHPMETAEGYDYLMKHEGYTADQLADELGVGRSTIYASLKLCELSVYGRDMFYDGKLSQSTALLIARIPGEKLQSDAIKEILPQYDGADGMSFREASRHLQNRYTLRLSSAPFDTADSTLIPEVGNCTDCPMRSGNNTSVYHDIKSPDVCTSPNCYIDKRKAHVIRLKESGDKVISGKSAEKVWNSYGISGGYISADAPFYDAPKVDGKYQTYKQVLGEDFPAEAIVVRDDNNKSIRVVSESAVAAALIAAGYDVKPKGTNAGQQQKQKDRQDRNEQLTHARKEDFSKIHQMIQHPDVTPIMQIMLLEMLPHIAAFAVKELDWESYRDLMKINGLESSPLEQKEFAAELSLLCPVKNQEYLIHWALEAVAYQAVIVGHWVETPKDARPLQTLLFSMSWDSRKGAKTSPTPLPAAQAQELTADETQAEAPAEFNLVSPEITPAEVVIVEVSEVGVIDDPEVKAYLEKQVDAFKPGVETPVQEDIAPGALPDVLPAETAGDQKQDLVAPSVEEFLRMAEQNRRFGNSHAGEIKELPESQAEACAPGTDTALKPTPAAKAGESKTASAPLSGFEKAKLKGEREAARRKASRDKKVSGQPDAQTGADQKASANHAH